MDAASTLDWIAASGLFLAFIFTLLRTEVLNPRLEWTVSAPYLERLAWDLLGVCAGLRGWVIWSDVVQATVSEAALATALATVSLIGLVKVLWRSFWPRFDRWIFGPL